MAVFEWKGIENGVRGGGYVDAMSLAEARTILKDRRVTVTALKGLQEQAKEQKNEGDKKLKARRIKNKDLMIFTKKFATMVQAGLPILKTISMLEDQADNLTFKNIIRKIRRDVESGTPLSDAFALHPKVFDKVYINLMRAGETSGKLTLFLMKLVVQLEKSEKIRSRVKGALTYPVILMLVATGVITIMLIKVVPVFQKMFAAMGNSLPGPTQLIVNVSEFLRDPAKGGTLLVVLVLLFIGSRMAIRNHMPTRRKVHRFMLKLPILGEVIQKSTLSKVAMIEGNLSAAGVPVLDSLDIISESLTNVIYKESFADIKKGVSEGKTLSALYAASPAIYPATFAQMLAVGEETGNMDEMFESVARYYEEEFDDIVDRLSELLEPFMIVFMGITVGFIIIAMYMPIFQIGQMVQH